MPGKYWTGYPLLELGLPWLTPGAIDALACIVRYQSDVLEFGAGGSTLFFAERCQRVLTWEDDPKWRAEIRRRLKGKVNVRITGDLKAVLALKDQFDLILVDSGDKTDREAIARKAIHQVGPGGWFILDNYGRYKLDFLDGWNCWRYDDPHWSGCGTLIARLH